MSESISTCLITGGGGQLGRQLTLLLQEQSPYNVRSLGSWDLDITNPDAIAAELDGHPPDLCINCAAYTQVDKAESESEAAYRVNETGTRYLAEACRDRGIWLIHISTDYVFDGTQSTPYCETDPTNPLGVYGKSKLAGEEAIRKVCPHHIILRTAWVYGARSTKNFVKTMLRVGAEREELRVVCDQVGSPTWTGDIARAIAQLIPHLTPENAGTYHFTNSGVASWYDFAVAILERAAEMGYALEVKRIVPIPTSEYPTPAPRPAYSVLNSQKLVRLIDNYPPHWFTGLRNMMVEKHTIEAYEMMDWL
jgi:dTDP-4-dehydrorhamnose reductase